MNQTGYRARLVSAFVSLGLATAVAGCTTYRIVRWREPGSANQDAIFPQRLVRRSGASFEFARSAVPRTDIDTIAVRDIDGRMRPFAHYAMARHLKAFVVIRNDTILYERYFDGYTDSTRSSSFSVAKAVTSILLGIALDRGEIRSLDDPITTYIPELARKPAFQGVTVRHLLEMKSGFAYTATNGHLWHDLTSSDARYFYTTDRHAALADQHRQDEPGTRWIYKDSDAQLLGWVLTNSTGRSVAKQLEERVWRNIGAEFGASWNLDHRGSDGSENTAAGFNATARDFARLARLYLHHGESNGTQVVPAAWVDASTTLAPRPEPEVPVWWQMQHQHYWWIPMQNWPAERDFFADGAKGQRLYVDPRTNTIIVQLADDDAQDFPFRRITHYLAGEPYRYPRGIPGLLYQAAQRGASADSVRALFRQLTADQSKDPAGYFINEAGMIQVGNALLAEPAHVQAGVAVLELSSQRSPNSLLSRSALAHAYEHVGDTVRARTLRQRTAGEP